MAVSRIIILEKQSSGLLRTGSSGRMDGVFVWRSLSTLSLSSVSYAFPSHLACFSIASFFFWHFHEMEIADGEGRHKYETFPLGRLTTALDRLCRVYTFCLLTPISIDFVGLHFLYYQVRHCRGDLLAALKRTNSLISSSSPGYYLLLWLYISFLHHFIISSWHFTTRNQNK